MSRTALLASWGRDGHRGRALDVRPSATSPPHLGERCPFLPDGGRIIRVDGETFAVVAEHPPSPESSGTSEGRPHPLASAAGFRVPDRALRRG